MPHPSPLPAPAGAQGEQAETDPEPPAPVRKPRGFATMDPARVKELARKGGRAAQATGRAHRFTHAEAVAAGQKGQAIRRGERLRGE